MGDAITSRFRISSSPVLPSQKFEIEPPFLHFFSLRTNQYKPNLGTKQGSYYMPIPNSPNQSLIQLISVAFN